MTVTEYFTRLQGKRVLVLGLGVSNRPLVRLLLRFGIDVTGCDRTPREKLDPEVLELERLGAKLHLGDDYLTGISGDVAFRTPGLHPGNPELQALRATGTQFTSEMEAFFEACPCRIIGVTGSDGKTTTSTLISEILKHAGHRVWTGGNIGTPLLDQAEHMTPDDLVVLELSSFQLMDLRHSCHIAVVTNLAPNHLDVHRDMAEYIDAKKHIFTRQTAQDVLILNADNTITAGFAPEAAGEVRMFSRQTVPAHGASFRDGVIRRDGVPVVRQEEIKIPGLHNVENYMAAILAVEGLASDEDIRYVARNFGGVEHRIEFVREKDGVKASTTFLYSAGDDVRQTIAMAVSNQILENLGIEMVVEGVSWDELPARMYSEPLVLAWGSSNPKTSYKLYHSSNAGKDDWYNPENFTSKTVDGYLDAALSAKSLEEAIPFWQKAQWDGETGTSMRGECPYIFVLNKTHVYWAREGLDTGVQKIHAHGDAWPLVQNIAKWTWTK